ncbi:MAG: type I-U CRISPR-associated protein Csb2 [bacterium]
MAEYLCISVTFLNRCFHGRCDGGRPEWPPSPLRLMQAIIAGNADSVGGDGELHAALVWLEHQTPPTILAPKHAKGSAYRLSVPNNAMDLVGNAWARGKYYGAGDANPATHRTMKTVRPIHMREGDTVHYLWALDDRVSAPIDILARAAKRIIALGWGIDLVIGRASRVRSAELCALGKERWQPAPSTAPVTLRAPKAGTLQALVDQHDSFLNRVGEDGFVPVPPLTQFDMVGYRRPSDPLIRPCAVFELRHDDDSFCVYSQRKLIHIAGMLRHLAKEVMLASPPADVDDGWVRRYVAGHRDKKAGQHKQFSYIPLPSIGHRHADHLVRRVMIIAPVGDEGLLDYLAQRLSGQQLQPLPNTEFGPKGPPSLIRVFNDSVAANYQGPAAVWHSVTPVILPGHDDHKPAKTRKLIERALAQSGVDQPCEFEWSAFSRFPKAFSAHKYDRHGKLQGYFRPDHLETQTAVHMTVRFKDDRRVPGPITIGAGRHCGFGLMAPLIRS